MALLDDDCYVVRRQDQRRALSSPIRLEIVGHFSPSPGGLSVADLAERMGRVPGSLYYHVQILERAGLLRRAGSRRRRKRHEVVYRLVAPKIALPATRSAARDAVKAMSAAFRMAERDMQAALGSAALRREGPHRNFFAARFHCRISRKTLAEVNRRLAAIERLLARETRQKKVPAGADQYCSLTLALLPLRGRATDQPSR